jgi:hypothetical protein
VIKKVRDRASLKTISASAHVCGMKCLHLHICMAHLPFRSHGPASFFRHTPPLGTFAKVQANPVAKPGLPAGMANRVLIFAVKVARVDEG